MRYGLYGATGSPDFGDWAMMVLNTRRLLLLGEESEVAVYTQDCQLTRRYLIDNIGDLDLLERVSVEKEPSLVRDRTALFLDRVTGKVAGLRPIEEHRFHALLAGNLGVLPESFIESLRGLDVLVFSGGGYLQHGWGHKNLQFMAAFWAAGSILSKPVYFLGCSIGPMGRYEHYIRDTIDSVTGIMIRDGIGRTSALLDDCGYDRYLCGPDDLLFACDKSLAPYCSQPYAVIEIMVWAERHPMGITAVIEAVSGFTKWLIKHEGLRVVLVSLDPRDSIATEVISSVAADARDIVSDVTVLPPSCSMQDVFSVYAGCSFSLSFKYHPMIMAFGSGRPCLGVICDDDGYYQTKMEGACENVGVSPKLHTMELASVSEKSLIERYEAICCGWRGVGFDRMARLRAVQEAYWQEVLWAGKSL